MSSISDQRISAVEDRADRLGRMVAELVARAVNRGELTVDDSLRAFLNEHGWAVADDLHAWSPGDNVRSAHPVQVRSPG